MNYVLITGANGFIGRHLARSLASKGYQVSGIGHGSWSEQDAAIWGVRNWLNGDINLSNLRQLQLSCALPDVVYHLAGGSSVSVAISNPHDDFYRTVVGTAELLEWLRVDAPMARLVAVSSAAVYGSGHEGPILENAKLAPYSPYGHHKRVMEELCQSYAASYGLRVCIARLFSVFGVELKKQLLWDLCTRLAANERPIMLGGSGNELRDWTDVRDVVRALDLLAAQANADMPVFNVGTGISFSVRDIAARITSLWPLPDAARAIIFSGHSRPGDPFSLVANPERLNKLQFSWTVSVDDGLLDYVRWFKVKVRSTQ